MLAVTAFVIAAQCEPGQFGWLAPLEHCVDFTPNFGGWCSAPKAGDAPIEVMSPAANIAATSLRFMGVPLSVIGCERYARQRALSVTRSPTCSVA